MLHKHYQDIAKLIKPFHALFCTVTCVHLFVAGQLYLKGWPVGEMSELVLSHLSLRTLSSWMLNWSTGKACFMLGC